MGEHQGSGTPNAAGGQGQGGDARQCAPFWARFRKVSKPLGILILFFLCVDIFNPYGIPSASDKLSRDTFDAILAPWYDTGEGAWNRQAGPSDGPDTPQDASIVLLLDDKSLSSSQHTWPLPAQQWHYMLQSLAEEYRPAAVFLDVMFTHERPDPRLAPDVREAQRAQMPACDFFDTDPVVRAKKVALRDFIERNGEGSARDISYETAGARLVGLVKASHRDSIFRCLKYHYRPVDGPTYESRLMDLEPADRRHDTWTDPRIPLIQAVPNPDVIGKLAPRLLSADVPGDFVAANRQVHGDWVQEVQAGSNADDDVQTFRWARFLPERLLIPGLRGVATPAVVQLEVNPYEPGAMPLNIKRPFYRKNGESFIGSQVTTPAAAAVVAFCRHHPNSLLPGCKDLRAAEKGSECQIDTVTECGDWDWKRSLSLSWGLKPAVTEEYFKFGDTDENGINENKVTFRSKAESCAFLRADLHGGKSDIGRLRDTLTRMSWSVRIAYVGANNQGRVIYERCSYIPMLIADLNYWPARQTKLMRDHPDGPVDLGDLIDGRVVFIGTNFDIQKDRTLSPVHETMPGVFQHAMAFDNLLRAGADWRSPAAGVVKGYVPDGSLLYRFLAGFSWLDVTEVLVLFCAALIGIVMREIVTPTYLGPDGKTFETHESMVNAAWEPIIVLGLVILALLFLLNVHTWPIGDWVMIVAGLVTYYNERLRVAVREAVFSLVRWVWESRHKPARLAGVTIVTVVLVTSLLIDPWRTAAVLLPVMFCTLLWWAVRRLCIAVAVWRAQQASKRTSNPVEGEAS
ncbi:CHASE2 domain-containing protein [Rhodovibrio salinarum]|uniref:CHASE2 domain-containing protein n=1 Tax=Rhodovibrio salinarum TaxID=1087 RepID=A0A934V1Z3_9PROT|nr:CHASE2 domain-containing protein [Rhodovibrio salinarum]MBK1698876.1 CHASE2 domain-containing protein [Rhodovibrio salinarum]